MNFNIENPTYSPVPFQIIREPLHEKINNKEFHSLDRKRKLHSIEEKPKKPNKKCSKTKISWLEPSELESKLNEVEKIKDFAIRINAFKKSFETNEDTLTFWLTTAKKANLFFEMVKGPYFSNIIDQQSFEESSDTLHDHLKVYESDEDGKINVNMPILHLRMNHKNGEIVWIRKGELGTISGNEVADLYLLFEKALLSGIDMYIYDDAKIGSMCLKPSVIGEGKSWYEKKFQFFIASCKNWILNDKVKCELHSQSSEEYAKALDNLQKMKLCELFKIYRRYPTARKKIVGLCQRAFGKKFQDSEDTRTLQNLVQEVSRLAREDKSQGQATTDQCFLFTTMLHPYVADRPTKLEIEFLHNLEIVNRTRILVKQLRLKKILQKPERQILSICTREKLSML